MEPWWTRKHGKETQAPRPKAVAYYRHSADIGQENSVEIQQDNVRAFAKTFDIEIIHEFADRGKSGLNAEGRPAFSEMLEWARTRNDFAFVLTLDVSRWGRFQDSDLSAHYESLCTQHNKQVIYTNIGMPGQQDILVMQLLKAMHRFQSADYVRKLSKGVFEGSIKAAQQGFRPGGAPRYGFYRMMLNEKKQPDRILEPGQRKGLQKGRTILVPGDADKVRTVRDIFAMFVEKRLGGPAIARALNARGVPPPGKAVWNKTIVEKVLSDERYRGQFDAGAVRDILAMSAEGRLKTPDIARALKARGVPLPYETLWQSQTVLGVLTDEQYRGCVVYNKSQKKMKSKTRRNPRAAWVVTPESYEPLIPLDLFEKARDILAEPGRRREPGVMLASLRALFGKYNVITPMLIRFDKSCPAPGCYTSKFGSLPGAFQAMFQDVIDRVKGEVVQAISQQARAVDAYEDFIVIDQRFTVLVQPSVPVPDGYGMFWVFRPDRRPVVDITLCVPLSDSSDCEILGYLALPRLMFPDAWVRLTSTSDVQIELHGYNGLDLIRELIDSQEKPNGQDPDSKHGPARLPDAPGGQGEGSLPPRP